MAGAWQQHLAQECGPRLLLTPRFNPPTPCMQARSSIGCHRSYLCMSRTCGVKGTQMCTKAPFGFTAVWLIDRVAPPPPPHLPAGCYTLELEKGREHCDPHRSEPAVGCRRGGCRAGHCAGEQGCWRGRQAAPAQGLHVHTHRSPPRRHLPNLPPGYASAKFCGRPDVVDAWNMVDDTGRQTWWLAGADPSASILGQRIDVRVSVVGAGGHWGFHGCRSLCARLPARPPRASRRASPAQNIGRSEPASHPACANHLTTTEACELAGGTLTPTPGRLTKWILEPAGGDASRFYIRFAVGPDWLIASCCS